jgi:hypothetical protein
MKFIEKFNRLMDIVIEPVFFSILGIFEKYNTDKHRTKNKRQY